MSVPVVQGTLCLLWVGLQLAVGFALAAVVLYASWYDPELLRFLLFLAFLQIAVLILVLLKRDILNWHFLTKVFSLRHCHMFFEGVFNPPAPIADAVTFELYWRPEQEQFAQSTKMAELEKRLAQLEATVRCEPDSQNPLLVGMKGTSLVETVQVLQAKVNILDVAVLDQVEARLQVRGGRKEGTAQWVSRGRGRATGRHWPRP
ncbi:uncharacterized protein LJ206_020665 [Theristicus caerulescens]